MILVDANLLIYAANRSAAEHEQARAWLDDRLSGSTRVGLPWPSLLAFVRLATNPLVAKQPASLKDAWRQVEDWLSCDAAWIPHAGERHLEILGSLIRLPHLSPRLVADAHLAALSIEHGLTLCSTDGDFARFPGLSWQNPLTAQG